MGRSTLVIVAAAVVAAVGCGSRGAGPVRYRVSGAVTCGGRPVPYGEILFTPDGTKGNSGPQGIAAIREGRFDTTGSRAPGAAGGPTIVRVTALETPTGGLIAEREFPFDLPQADSEQTFDLPAAAATSARPDI